MLEELQACQSRPLDRVYPVIFIDALMVKIGDGVVANRPVYRRSTAMALNRSSGCGSGPVLGSRASSG